jgi:hypothetical protein
MLLNIPSPFLATSHIQKELYRLMPFLAYYRIKKGSFVIDDIRSVTARLHDASLECTC